MNKFFFFCLILIGFACVNKEKPGPTHKKKAVQVNKPAIQSILDSALVQGSILIYSQKDNAFYSNDFNWALRKFLPASTFKIPNSIIALESGVMEHDSVVIPWDGEPRAFRMWEKDLMFRDAFRVSCVPCYQEIAREVGVDRMRRYLDTLNYHDMVFDKETIDNFWLTGPSELNQFQQIGFLKKLYNSKLPISKRSEAIVQEMMILYETDNYVLSGKTGWNMQEDYNNGWFVGRLQAHGDVFYFATNIEPLPKFDMDNFIPIRMEITKQALVALKMLN